jgi:secreted trypsin-like serine protease
VRIFKTENLRVFFGRHNLASKRENDWTLGTVSEVFKHEDYGKIPGNHDADIAVLKLAQSVTFTDKIQPICLPGPDESIREVVGTVVGYGQNEIADQHEDIPRYIEGIRTIDLAKCAFTDSRYFHLASLRTFCAGGQGKGPCRGDSGGGFLMKSPRTHRWTLYGIVGASLYDPTLNTCDVNKYAVYSDIFYFLDWIRNVVEPKNGRNDGLKFDVN